MRERNLSKPCLLERLVTDLVSRTPLSHDELDRRAVVQSVKNNLGWLLTTLHYSADRQADSGQHKKLSVTEFGLPDFSIAGTSQGRSQRICQTIRHAIHTFEPRIQKNSLKVTVAPDSELDANRRTHIVIEGEIIDSFGPTRVSIDGVLDLTSGGVTLQHRA